MLSQQLKDFYSVGQDGILHFPANIDEDSTLPVISLSDGEIRGISNKNLNPSDKTMLLQANFEHCKNDVWVRRGRCLRQGCSKTRWHSDTTGYCGDCKIELGMKQAPRQPTGIRHARPREERTGTVQPPVAKDFVASQLLDKMFKKIVNDVSHEKLQGIVEDMFQAATHQQKTQIVETLLQEED
jgi:hypothetical protein